MGRMRERARTALREAGVPEDVALGTARVVMLGEGAARIENHHGLVELTQTCIRLRTQGGTVCVQGKGLKLRALTADVAEVEGSISNIGQGDAGAGRRTR